MMRQRLSPGVEDGDAADRGAEPAWIGGERRHRLGGGLEQDGIDDGLVLKGDRGDRSRKCEDDVEIGNRQQVGFARGEPRGSGCSPDTSDSADCGRNYRRSRVVPQSSQASMWPPSASVRHATIALITRRSTRPR